MARRGAQRPYRNERCGLTGGLEVTPTSTGSGCSARRTGEHPGLHERASCATSSAVAPPLLTIASVCLLEIAAREPGSEKPRPMPDCSISQAALSFTWCSRRRAGGGASGVAPSGTTRSRALRLVSASAGRPPAGSRAKFSPTIGLVKNEPELTESGSSAVQHHALGRAQREHGRAHVGDRHPVAELGHRARTRAARRRSAALSARPGVAQLELDRDDQPVPARA